MEISEVDMKLSEMAEQARRIASALCQGPACNHRTRCLEAEDKRPLTGKEKARGWTRRPFDCYEPGTMCDPCQAYWYAEMAAQTLHRLACLEVKEANRGDQ